MEDQIVSTVFNYGFPSAIATYALVVMNKTMQKLHDAVNRLTLLIERNI